MKTGSKPEIVSSYAYENLKDSQIFALQETEFPVSFKTKVLKIRGKASDYENSKFTKNQFLAVIFIFILIISFVGSVSAITGSLGNARMILRANAGDTIEKYVLVKNVNEEEIKIGLRASGDLGEYINLEENEFTLAPGEEKKAYFTIKVPTNGTTESRIEVTFSSETQKNGVGLASTIIVIAEEGEDSNIFNLFENFDLKTIILIATGLIVLIFVILLIIKSKRVMKTSE